MKRKKAMEKLMPAICILVPCFYLHFSGASAYSATAFMRQSLILGVCSLGLYLEIMSGDLDMSFAVQVGTGTVLFSAVSAKSGAAAGALVLLLFHIAAGGIKGWLISRLRVSPIIITLAMQQILRGMTSALSDESYYPASLGLRLYSKGWVWRSGFAMLIVLTAGIALLMKETYFGRFCTLVGTRRAELREFAGITCGEVLVTVHVLAGILFALASFMLVVTNNGGYFRSGEALLYQAIMSAGLGGVLFSRGKGNAFRMIMASFAVIALGRWIPMQQVPAFLQGGSILISAAYYTWSEKLRESRKSSPLI